MNHTSNRCSIFALAVGLASLFASARPAQAVIFMDIGTVTLAPGTSGQQVQLFFTSDTSVDVGGLDFNIQIADGGPDAGGSISGPSITSVDIVSGTIFDGQSPNVSAVVELPQIQVHSLDLASDVTIPANTQLLFATLTIDTTGFNTLGQSWDFKVVDTLNDDSQFIDGLTALGIPNNISNGSLQIGISAVPEPAEYAMVAGVGLVFFAFVRRRTKSRLEDAGD